MRRVFPISPKCFKSGVMYYSFPSAPVMCCGEACNVLRVVSSSTWNPSSGLPTGAPSAGAVSTDGAPSWEVWTQAAFLGHGTGGGLGWPPSPESTCKVGAAQGRNAAPRRSWDAGGEQTTEPRFHPVSSPCAGTPRQQTSSRETWCEPGQVVGLRGEYTLLLAPR